MTIGVLLAWRLALTPLLLSVGFLGVAREAIPDAAFERLAPDAIAGFMRQGAALPMSVSASVATLALWTLVALALGSWRTRTRDA